MRLRDGTDEDDEDSKHGEKLKMFIQEFPSFSLTSYPPDSPLPLFGHKQTEFKMNSRI